MRDDFLAQTDRLLAWFKLQGGTFRDDLIELRDLRAQDAGRGIVAIADIPQDTVLFTVPRSIIINVETSELAKQIPGVFDNDDEELPLDPWSSLILVMIYEYLQGPKSRWHPYFNVLPEVFDTPIFWSDSELQELNGTCLTREKIGKQESEAMIKARIIPVIRENPSVFCLESGVLPKDDHLLALAHRMGSIIMAYAFDLEKDDEENQGGEEDDWIEDREMLGMVPMADMMNANAEFNAHVNHDTSLEIMALRTMIPKGTEILNYYGPLPSSELLRRYGYTIPDHHRYDVVEIHWDDVKKSLWRHFPMLRSSSTETSKKISEDFEDIFIMERDSGDPNDQDLKDQFKSYIKAHKNVLPELESDSKKPKDMYYTVLAEVLSDKLRAYSTTIAEDEELLARDSITKRRRMAIEVRLGEKRLIMEAINLINKTSVQKNGHHRPKKARIS